MNIFGTIKGDVRVYDNLRRYPQAVYKRLFEVVTRLTIRLQGKVKRDKLSGQVLKTRTGTLRRSINQRVDATPDSIIGRVGTNVPYGRVHEFGFRGTVPVKEHLRTSKATGRQFTVQSHTRKVDLPERSFLRSAIREMKPTIVAEIKKAMRPT